MKRRIHITGIVQGVGFRPFVHNLATRLGLKGWCLNDSDGVVIEVEGSSTDVFLSELSSSPPPLSRIREITFEDLEGGTGEDGFVIRESRGEDGHYTLISPDIATCAECIRELFDPSDRRHLYPFINCTNCGPRYSIILDIPYDRPKTTMAPFVMCAECADEYGDPFNRRFHAQPNACAGCGPRAWLSGKGTVEPLDDERNFGAIRLAARHLRDGAILAVKGLGGFHLACDATNEDSVRRLRQGKRSSAHREARYSNKPFALMVPDIDAARGFARVSPEEERVLAGHVRPIVLLEKTVGGKIAPSVAPGNSRLGVMLPYTPLHHILMRADREGFAALVMTSGNLSDEPIVTDNEEAASKLSGMADFLLLHDREIYMRVDDSIARVDGGRTRVFRRARGFTPDTVQLDDTAEDLLACGPHLKNTFCITRGANAVQSQHMGDLDNIVSTEFFLETLRNLKSTFRAEPASVAHDLHPDYESTRLALDYALTSSIPEERIVAVQHHHAHVASCMVEHGLKGPVIGVSFDGTGLGTDGRIWGGEFMISGRLDFRRAAHLDYLPMPGGEAAAAEPWRMAVSCLVNTYGEEAEKIIKELYGRLDHSKLRVVSGMISRGLNCPLTSSAGRLFDAVASLAGIADIMTFEGEAAIALESAAASTDGAEPYPFRIIDVGSEEDPWRVDTRPLVRGIVEDLALGAGAPEVSARFHLTVSEIISTVASRLSAVHGITDVVLTGGVFQNALLTRLAGRRLWGAGLRPWFNELVPTNDGGVSLGQAVVAIERLRTKKNS